VEVFVARVHGLLAAPVGSKTGGKSALRYFLSVPQDDTTAMYECHPYALVSRWSSGVVELKVTDNEVHQWLPCCEDTCASELLSGLDSDSEEEGEDECECGKRAEIDTAASNVKCEGDVSWDAVGGPVVSQDSIQHLLGLLDALAEHKANSQPTRGRGGRPSSAQAQQQQGQPSATPSRPPQPARGPQQAQQQERVAEQKGTQQRAGKQRVASRQRHTPQQTAEQGGRQAQSVQQQQGGEQQQQPVTSTTGRKIEPPGWRAQDLL
jgi:hypothetical protein